MWMDTFWTKSKRRGPKETWASFFFVYEDCEDFMKGEKYEDFVEYNALRSNSLFESC